jgi:adenosylhomocysteine nucleosidase
MKIGIIAAMDQELQLLKEKLSDAKSWTRAGVVFYSGTYANHEVVLVKSGIGKVQAAMTATLLIHNFGVQALINTGSAGGIGSGLKVGDVVISDKTAYWDADVTAFGYEIGQLPAQPRFFEASKYLLMEMEKAVIANNQHAHRGLIVSGDSFISSPEKTQQIRQNFPEVLAVEMEGAAIAQVAHQFGIGYLVIRAMSDTADEKATQSFDEFIIEAGRKSAAMVINFLEHVK